MLKDEEDLHLVDRILKGEQSLYGELVDRYKRYAFTIAYKILNSRQDAEEASQDAFVKAYRHLGDFNRQARFSTWLYRIVFNTAVSYRRRRKGSYQDIEKIVVVYGPDAHRLTEKEDRKKFINQAIGKLSDPDKWLITLYYLQEFSQEEIADITGMAANTVKVRIHRARLRLATELKNILNKEALSL